MSYASWFLSDFSDSICFFQRMARGFENNCFIILQKRAQHDFLTSLYFLLSRDCQNLTAFCNRAFTN